MNHRTHKEWLQLLVYDELTADEHALLDRHLPECPECRQELEDLKRFHAALARAGGLVPEDKIIYEARLNLRTALHSEGTRLSLLQRFQELLSPILPGYRIALGGAALVSLGVLLGKWTFFSVDAGDQIQPADQIAASLNGETRITNVRFIDPDAADGEIEFTFDAVSPMHIKGSITDDRVQKVLAHALVNDQNPGVRLRSVNAFSSRISILETPDPEVKAALILAAKTDDNPGVRKEALGALQGIPFDEEIKQALLHVLMRDSNPALRIAAINSLDSARAPGQVPDRDLLEVLRQRMTSDNNSYVRIRAKAALQEAQQ
jgi:hypothetical protein